jgi:cytochrome P450
MTTAEKHEFPMVRTCPFAPPPAYEEIREQEPVSRVRLPDGGWAWVVSRHEDARTVLNNRRFSADRQHPDFPALVEGEAASRRPDEERWAAMEAIQGYMADLIAEKEKNPPDDLLRTDCHPHLRRRGP